MSTTSLGYEFDAEQVEPAGSFEPMPPGKYEVMATNSEVKESKAGDSRHIKLELTVLSGDYAGRKIFEYITLDCSPPPEGETDKKKYENKLLSVDIGKKKLKSLCDAIGKTRISDSTETHDIPMLADVRIRAGDGEYGPQNQVFAYMPLNGQQPPKQQAAAKASQKPAGQQQGGKMPWQK